MMPAELPMAVILSFMGKVPDGYNVGYTIISRWMQAPRSPGNAQRTRVLAPSERRTLGAAPLSRTRQAQQPTPAHADRLRCAYHQARPQTRCSAQAHARRTGSTARARAAATVPARATRPRC